MNIVLYIGLHDKSLELLQENIQVSDVLFQETSVKDFKETCRTLQNCQAILIGEKIDNPIRFAQDIYAQDKAISILLINDAGNNEKIKKALLFSPFVGPTVQCVSNESGKRMAPIVEDAMQRTEQRRSFARMKQSSRPEQRFVPNAMEKVRTDFTTKVLEKAPIGAVLISGSGTIFSINQFALNLFKKSEKEVLGTVVLDLFPEDSKARISIFLSEGYLSEQKRVFELKWPDDPQFLELSVAPIDIRLSSNYKLLILNDITSTVEAQQRTQAHLEELEKLNANLARVNTDLDTFVYTASHDLKSPILNIEGLVASLEEELGPEQASLRPELEHIKRSINRFKKTVEDLTEVSRIQKSFEEEATLIDVATLLNEVKQLMEREIEETGAVIELNAGAHPSLYFSKRNMTSVLYNLLSNTIKYRSTSRKLHVKISTWRENDEYCIAVQDNGLGIPAAKRERVFQLFKRMHSHVQGSGVGLYIVKRIIDSNRGSISVESEEGKGTTFTIRLKEYVPEKRQHANVPAS